MRLFISIVILVFSFIFYQKSYSQQDTCEKDAADYAQIIDDICGSPKEVCNPRVCTYYQMVSQWETDYGHARLCLDYAIYSDGTRTPDTFSVAPLGRCPKNTEKIKIKNQTPKNAKIKCASILGVENQTLAEVIPLVGVSFSLAYSSNLQIGRSDHYRLDVPVTGVELRDYVTSFEVGVYRGSTRVANQSFVNNRPNQKLTYVWNGRNSNNTADMDMDQFTVLVKEFSPSGATPIYSVINLGHFNVGKIGMGGWAPSILYNYNPHSKLLTSAFGETRTVTAKPFKGTSDLFVPSEDGTVVYVFDSNGRHKFTKTGLLGANIFQFDYDSSGKLIAVRESFNRITRIQYDSSGRISRIIAPKGQATQITVDPNGFVETVTNPNTEVYRIKYINNSGLMSEFRNPIGRFSTFTYDSEGRVIKDAHSGGSSWTLEPSRASNYSAEVVTKSRMNRTSKTQTFFGMGSAVIRTNEEPDGSQSTYEYMEGHPSDYELSTSAGVTVESFYQNDARFGEGVKFLNRENYNNGGGNSVTDFAQTIELSDVTDPFSITAWQETATSSVGLSDSTIYNPKNKRFTKTSILGRRSEVVIDNYERIRQTRIGNQAATNYVYSNDKLVSKTQGSRVTTYVHNGISGLLETVTDPLGYITKYGYNSAGRVTTITLPDGRIILYGYNANGELNRVTPPGRPGHTFGFNAHELMSSYVPPALTGVTPINTTYSYNLDRQLTKISRPTGQSITYTYGNDGTMLRMTTPDGVTSFTWNPNIQNFSEIVKPDNSRIQLNWGSPSDLLEYYNFDSSGRNMGGYYKSYGNQLLVASDTVIGNNQSSIAYQYNFDHKLNKSGELNIRYSYPNGSIDGTTIWNGASQITDKYYYNSFGEIEKYEVHRGGVLIYMLNLSRDESGRIHSRWELYGDGSYSGHSYNFDPAGRLTHSMSSSRVSQYIYDNNGNRYDGSLRGNKITATYNNQDWLLTYNSDTFTHNNNGDRLTKQNSVTNQTTQYTYDVFGNLVRVQLSPTNVITYEVDALNRRIGKRVNGNLQKRWVYMDQNRIAAELNAAGNVVKRFVYGSKSNIPDYMIASGVKYRIISDHLGSPRLVIKQSDGTIIQKMNHDEFGRVLEDTNPGFIPYGFAGGLYDAQTNLVRFGARDYDPETGRWTSKDPILFNGKMENLYGYAFLDPVNWIDPTGESPWGYAYDMVLININDLINGYDPATSTNFRNQSYTKQILFDKLVPIPGGGQCPVPSERTAPPNFPSPLPIKGYPRSQKGPIRAT